MFKFLFGTLDNDDYEHLNSKFDKFESNSKSLLHMEADRLTYMRKLNTQVEKNSQIIESLTQIIRQTVVEIDNTTFAVVTEVNQLKKRLAYQAKVSSLFRAIELTISMLNTQLIQLQEALDVKATGYLSSMLIPPAKLNDLLQEVVLKLPTGLSLILENELDKNL